MFFRKLQETLSKQQRIEVSSEEISSKRTEKRPNVRIYICYFLQTTFLIFFFFSRSVTKVYKCHCDKVYKTKYGLTNHMKTCATASNFPTPFNIEAHTFEVPVQINENSVNLTSNASLAVNGKNSLVTNNITFNNATSTVQPMDATNKNAVSYVRLSEDLCTINPMSQVAEQIIIDTSHSYSMPSTGINQTIKKEPNTASLQPSHFLESTGAV